MTAFRTIIVVLVGMISIVARAAAPTGPVELEQGVHVAPSPTWRLVPTITRGTRMFVEASKASAQVVTVVEHRRTHDEAVERLGKIARAWKRGSTSYVTIDGWPAVELRYQAPIAEREGRGELTPHVTVAIAADRRVVRYDGLVMPGGDARLAEEVVALAHATRFDTKGQLDDAKRAIERLKAAAPAPRRHFGQPGGIVFPPPGPRPSGGGGGGRSELSLLPSSGSELQVAASNDGKVVVVADSAGTSTSTDSGNSFGPHQPIPYVSCSSSSCPWRSLGDPSVTRGATGTFYAQWIGQPTGQKAALNFNGCADEVTSSPNGSTFAFVSHSVACPLNGTKVATVVGPAFLSCVPDQPFLIADPKHKVNGHDQLYSVLRLISTVSLGAPVQCPNVSGSLQPTIVCSTDGGRSWAQAQPVDSGDHARAAVAADGTVFVAYEDGDEINFMRFTSCKDGLQPMEGYPQTAGEDVNQVTCPVPGLDRCSSSYMTSHSVAADPDDASHVMVAWASATSPNNEDIVVADSEDGGNTWSPPFAVNRQQPARRFMPWICADSGQAFVGWYDRRRATSANNDLTDYFVGVAEDNTARLGLIGPEFRMSTNADPQCATWPTNIGSNSVAPDAANDATSCSVQPQLAGLCSANNAPCNYNVGCGNNGTCSTGRGAPKYGDYNGFTCANGRVYAAWASATAQRGTAAPGRIRVFTRALSPSTLEVGVSVKVDGKVSAAVPKVFVVSIDGVARGFNLGSGQGVGPAILSAGKHNVGIAAAGTVGTFKTTFSGDCDAKGNVTLAAGEHKACSIINTFTTSSICLTQCDEDRNRCMADLTAPGHQLARECAGLYKACEAGCSRK